MSDHNTHSHAPAPEPAQPKGESFIHEIGEGIGSIAVYEGLRTYGWKIFKYIASFLKDATLEGGKEISKEAVQKTLKTTFRNIRPLVENFIDYEIRGEDPVAADGLLAKIDLIENCGPKPYPVPKGESPNYQPLDEFKLWAVLMAYYLALKEEGKFTDLKETFKRLGRSKNPKTLDQFVRNMTHDPIRQAFAWLSQSSLPLREQLKVVWELLSNKSKLGVYLGTATPLWIVLAGMIIYALRQQQTPVLVWILAVAVVLLAVGLGIVNMFLRQHIAASGTNKPTDENAASDSKATSWRRIASVLTRTTIGGFALFFIVITAVFTPPEYALHVASFSIALIFIAAFSSIAVGSHPLLSLLIHGAGEIKRNHNPLGKMLRFIWRIVVMYVLFAAFYPFAHLDSQIPIVSLFALLLMFSIVALAYAEKSPALRTFLTVLLLAIFAYGFIDYGRELAYAKKLIDRFNPPTTKTQTTTSIATETATVTTTEAAPAPRAKKTKRSHRQETIPVPVVSTEDVTSHDYPEAATTIPVAPPVRAERSQEVADGEYQGILIVCEDGGYPTWNYGADGAIMCINTGGDILKVKYRGLSPIDINGHNAQMAGLQLGMELRFQTRRGWIVDGMARR